jgi:hypothetical protein
MNNALIIPEAKDYDRALELFPEANGIEIEVVAKKLAYVNAHSALNIYRAEKNAA